MSDETPMEDVTVGIDNVRFKRGTPSVLTFQVEMVYSARTVGLLDFLAACAVGGAVITVKPSQEAMHFAIDPDRRDWRPESLRDRVEVVELCRDGRTGRRGSEAAARAITPLLVDAGDPADRAAGDSEPFAGWPKACGLIVRTHGMSAICDAGHVTNTPVGEACSRMETEAAGENDTAPPKGSTP